MKVLKFFNQKRLDNNTKQITKDELLKLYKKQLLLESFKEQLKKNFSHDTAKTYFSALNCALKNQKFSSMDAVRWDLILEYALTLKNRTQVSKLKNALKHFDHKNYLEHREDLNKIHLSKWKSKRKYHETFMLDSTLKRINNIRNMKLKIAFRLMLLTGIRVQELSNIKKCDIVFVKKNKRKNGKESYQVTIRKGKGGKSRSLFGIKDDYVQKNLKELLKNLKDKDNVFYSANYMQQMAFKYGFHCHQLRRAFAHIAFYHFECEVEALQYFLGHVKNTKTYLKYINYPVSLYGTRFDIGE